jgi:hypothetical protein
LAIERANILEITPPLGWRLPAPMRSQAALRHHRKVGRVRLRMQIKLFMMPQTVPNRPINGAVAAIVATIPVARIILRPMPASMRLNRAVMGSLMPSIARRSEERAIGFHGADQKRAVETCSRCRGAASASERAACSEHWAPWQYLGKQTRRKNNS